MRIRKARGATTIVTTPRARPLHGYCYSVTAVAGATAVPSLLLLLQGHRHHTAEPGTAWTPDEPTGAEPLGLLHRERSGTEHVPLGTTDDGALHQVLRVPSPRAL